MLYLRELSDYKHENSILQLSLNITQIYKNGRNKETHQSYPPKLVICGVLA